MVNDQWFSLMYGVLCTFLNLASIQVPFLGPRLAHFFVLTVLMVAVTAMEGSGFSEASDPTVGFDELTMGALTAAVATIVVSWHLTLCEGR